MKHLPWLLMVLTLALGCGRDKKAWAGKIDKLVQRAYACQDIACAKQVEEEMGKIIGSDEGRNLDDGEPELMFGAAERIRNRVAELEAGQKTAAMRATSPLSALQVFETTIRACTLAYGGDIHHPVRATVEASIGKVGAKLPPDTVPEAKTPGGLFWMHAFEEAFNKSMDGKVPIEDAIYASVAAELCVVNYRYNAAKAKNPEMFGPSVSRIEKIMTTLERHALVTDLVAAVRRAAPDEEVFALTKKTTQAIQQALQK